MRRYIPSGYSETSDAFAALMVDAPEFSVHGQTISEAFEQIQLGIDSVIEKTKRQQAIELLQHCKSQLTEIEQVFIDNKATNDPQVRKATRHRLQRLYYDSFLKAGPLLKPGRKSDDIGPDDDV